MKTENKCPVCGNDQLKDVYKVLDFRGSNEAFNLKECKECSFVVTSPRPEDKDLGDYYPKHTYVSHNEKPTGVFDRVYFQVQKANLKDKLRKIQRHCKKGSLLDYGCGSGSFLEFMQQNGWSVEGVELSKDAAEIASKRTESKVWSPEEFVVQPNKYDVISLWHVLEHLPAFEEIILKLKLSLKPGGILLIAVPNHKSYDAGYFGNNWAAWDVPIHLWHFNREVIKRLAKKWNLNHAETRPMPFDAFYVSMLSAQNQKSKFWFLQGAWRGLLSNLKAKENKEASSLIYILKRAL